MPDVIDDFVSGDSHRVWSAMWQTIRTRDTAELDAIVAALPEIRRATDGLDLGGALHPNRESLRHAFSKVANYRKGACWCANYPGHQMYDPEREQEAGHIRILSASEPDWSMTFRCECAVCGTVFDVQQGEYHYTWWKWTRSPAARAPRATSEK